MTVLTIHRIAVCVLAAILFYGALTSTTRVGTPPGFECAEYMSTAQGIVTQTEWEFLNSLTQTDCEALFYPFEKLPQDTLVEYLESGYFINDLALFEYWNCQHFIEFHCMNCDPAMPCEEVKEISEKYYAERNDNHPPRKSIRELWWDIVMFWDRLMAHMPPRPCSPHSRLLPC